MSLTINNLIVEVTRRCNMKCEHCLRGNAQRLDMSQEVIGRLFDDVGYVSSITFTGGEPSLAVPVIEKIIEAARMYRVDIGNFFVVTNGRTSKPVAKRLALALLDLYSTLCDHEEGITGLTVSGDAYHDPDVKIPDVYRGLSFFTEERHGPTSEEGVIRTGRAEFNGIGLREARKLGRFEVDGDVEADRPSVDTVYVSANGNVVNDCDCSYKDIDAQTRGNVLRETLTTIVRRDYTPDAE
jgi:hypothetical protein